MLIPPAFGLAGVGFETYTADGPISYWNSYVAVTQMGGHGSFRDPRLGISIVQTAGPRHPQAAGAARVPAEPAHAAAARRQLRRAPRGRGQAVFQGAGKCATCHTGPTYTDVLTGSDPRTPVLHSPAETGMDPAYAARTATNAYRTEPLRGLWQHPPYFHDGSAATLPDVVAHYDQVLVLGLSAQEKADLVEFLKSL